MLLVKSEAYRFGELFAGAADTTFAVKLCGIPAFKLDRDYGGMYNDFMSPAGYACLVMLV